MNEDDIQNSVRLIRLYHHLPKEHFDEVYSLIIYKTTYFGAAPPDVGNAILFAQHLDSIRNMSEKKIFEELAGGGGFGIVGGVLLEIVKHMKSYLSTRPELIEENIHWTL